ncbi:MAG: signal recognition particle protein [Candidatus Eremiobacteraeota bacterium]|nr:signal recognition particle protein [Candidatus Eremiobacteraeota bacterium]
MFESLQERLQGIFQKLKRRGKLSEEDVNLALREIRIALIAADVNIKVVKQFTKKVKEAAIGEEIWHSLTPAQQVIKIVKDELVDLMGSVNQKVNMAETPPTIVMMVGLHGSGKTTSTGKLAMHFRTQGHHPLMVATDIYRPAAIKQLEVLGKQIDIPVFQLGDKTAPVNICRGALKYAQDNLNDIILIDTAGRLHIDEELMDELKEMKAEIRPSEVLLVVDSMIGQDAVTMAKSFNESIGIDGIVLTKLDGDARGGAALSVRAVTGKPIKFVGVGEKLSALELFHPDRMASRILGMGDMLSLIEKAEMTIDKEKAMELEKKIRTQEFTLEDFLEQMEQVQKMGPLEDLMGMMPGVAQSPALKNMKVDEKQIGRIKAVIQSMTPEERNNPKLLNAKRRKRIARGSGSDVSDVNRLIKQFHMVKKMMKQFTGMEKGKHRGKLKIPFMG